MTDSSVIATNSILPVRGSWLWRIAIVAILTALADWLFFRHVVGMSLAFFVLAVGAGVLLANRIEATRREMLLYGGILVVAVLPSLEDFNVMSALVAALGTGCFAHGATAALKGNLNDRLIAVGWLLFSGPFQFFRDLPLLQQWMCQHGAPAGMTAVKGWIVPLTVGAIFMTLFATANPLIANWFAQWSIGESLKQIDLQRLMFWLAAIIAVWTFVCVGRRFALPNRDELVAAAVADLAPMTHSNLIFNEAAVMRSLVLFNLLFAVQTVMDINYLWRGAALPDGMSYASYAHRGAYPLIVTALLAAAFVIVAMRPGSGAERSPVMRALVFLWVGQNVLLVASSILRLNLYVATYLLTYWRVAAFIWMLIVVAGLVLIVVRIVTYRSNAWLISANLVVLALTIYLCSFVNFANLVASYNVSHGRNAASAGVPVDLTYLAALGPQAIPALDRYIATHAVPKRSYFPLLRNQLAAAHLKDAAGWRAWTLRGWRLTRYLDGVEARAALIPP
jgi:Domain of unknown function (DUF4153)